MTTLLKHSLKTIFCAAATPHYRRRRRRRLHHIAAQAALRVVDSICQFTPPTSKTSGYYIGSCTDKSFNSSACSRECCELSLPPDFCVSLRRRRVQE